MRVAATEVAATKWILDGFAFSEKYAHLLLLLVVVVQKFKHLCSFARPLNNGIDIEAGDVENCQRQTETEPKTDTSAHIIEHECTLIFLLAGTQRMRSTFGIEMALKQSQNPKNASNKKKSQMIYNAKHFTRRNGIE